jgi:hypothetical protein
MCLRELKRTDEKWKYFLSTAGSEMPLMSIGEMEFKLRKEDFTKCHFQI